jgi:hypothetical protein
MPRGWLTAAWILAIGGAVGVRVWNALAGPLIGGSRSSEAARC